MEFVKRNSTYVEAVQFLGDEQSIVDIEQLMSADYKIINLGVYKKEFEKKAYGENKKYTASFANFFVKHVEKQKEQLLSIPEMHYLVSTKLGLRIVDPEKFEKDYSEVK